MPAAPAAFPHLTRKYNRWVVRLPIPKAQQAILARKMFRAVMPQADGQSAYVASIPIVAEWRHRIEIAKTASRDHLQAEILRLRTEYERYRGKSLDADGCELFNCILDFLFQRFGGVSAAAQRLALADAKGDAVQALRAIPGPAQANRALQQIMGLETAATQFLDHLEAFRETTNLKGKALAQAIAEIRQFDKAVSLPLERITPKAVQGWIDVQLHERGLRSASVMHKIASLQAYWKWLYKHEVVTQEIGPFHRRDTRDGRNGAEEADNERLPFAPQDVSRLWRAAEAQGDDELAACIRLAAYTGIRRNGMCSLKVSSVMIDQETGIRCLHVSEKTRAGRRAVPVHSAINGLVKKLVADAGKDNYLIHDPGVDCFGYRGDHISERFMKLKAKLGFSEQQDFHSLRHTFQSELERRGVREKVRKNLMGHKVTDITDGRYGTMTPLIERRDAIEKLEYPA